LIVVVGGKMGIMGERRENMAIIIIIMTKIVNHRNHRNHRNHKNPILSMIKHISMSSTDPQQPNHNYFAKNDPYIKYHKIVYYLFIFKNFCIILLFLI
jgi:hypothetical protein